jgi:23S rRNA (pseudouridine1915-N3)-methyltransferase
MHIHLLAVGQRMPKWINDGFAEFADRLPPECSLMLRELKPGYRSSDKPDIARAVSDEGTRMMAAIPRLARVVALDERGQPWTSAELAQRLKGWMADGRDVALLVGGGDGLAPVCHQKAESTWSLSPLTLPHGMVRVVVAEQIYRAWTILKNHPYHRA